MKHLLQPQHLPPVPRGVVTHVNPPEVLFVNQLVKWQFEALNKVEQFLILCLVANGNIGRMTRKVLTVLRPAHGLVEAWAPVAAVDVYRPAVRLPQWVEDILHKGGKVPLHSLRWRVVYPLHRRRMALAQFCYRKVFHNF